MFAKVSSVAVVGMDARPVDVEIDIGQGLPDFHVVGLPSTAVKEAPRRVKAAVNNSGRCTFPQRRVTASLAPGDLRKDGVLFDLPLAIGVLAAMGNLKFPVLDRYGMVGELTLDGNLRPIRGALAAALAARDHGWEGLVVPRANLLEAGLVSGINVVGAANLAEAIDFLGGGLTPCAAGRVSVAELLGSSQYRGPDLCEVRGQAHAVRAMEIAAAGGHNLLLVGPPGCGKTMMAQRLPGILPPLSEEEALEATRVWSVAGMLAPEQALITERPFRAPHHHASAAAIIGGGSYLPRPGEISLAHRGVLFLDELPLFSRPVLEALRQPLEEGKVRVVRQATRVEYPADFSLVAAANPCLCPGGGGSSGQCGCPQGRLEAYRSRLSGPLLDRVDLQVEVPRLTQDELFDLEPAEPSALVRDRVIRARSFREGRLESGPDATGLADLDTTARRFLRRALGSMDTSARGMDRVVRVARSIADLAASMQIEEQHLAEALQYRRPVWGTQ
ncbi:MAG TPA: YifB family Mg chelatase-like AAA ATPase [Actinomycetota bacterium]|nr:YifB family Mg chelatase-like AAA ATPase [Actinomycetota bacterium]